MAEKTTIARPYARAAFEIAAETHAYEPWSVALQVLATTAVHKETQRLLKDSSVPVNEIVNLFVEVSEPYLNTDIRSFIFVVAQAKRLSFLPEIAALYEHLRQAAEKTVAVDFISAFPLNESQKSAFQNILETFLSKQTRMHYSVDASLLGGFVAQAGNDVIDGSVRGHLLKLKEAMGE